MLFHHCLYTKVIHHYMGYFTIYSVSPNGAKLLNDHLIVSLEMDNMSNRKEVTK